MQEIHSDDATRVAGGNAFLNFLIGKAADWASREVLAGHVDYAGLAESQGSYYNTVGA